ncbi:MAG: hypothetical protein LBS03_05570 [Bacteroidales bacterium]|nr:hypothetical protein [Bacteroidales bacterium]
MVVFAGIGAGLGATLYFCIPVTYSSLLVAETGGINSDVVIDQINLLSVLTEKPPRLAKFLHLDEESAKKITFFKAYYGIDLNRDNILDFIDYTEKYDPRDTTMRKLTSYVYLKASVSEEDMFFQLKEKILAYLSNNEYIHHLYRISMQQKIGYIHELEKEMTKIDSLQNGQLRQSLGAFKDIVLMNKPDLKLFHADMLALYSQKQAYERDTALFKQPISVIQDFTPLGEEDRTMSWYMYTCGIISAIIGLLCALLWQYRKRIYLLIKEDATKH